MAAGKEKLVAIGKHAKIDKAQRNMFVAVCIASIILGMTAVAVVYFVQVIRFNATVIGEKAKVIDGYKEVQKNLTSVSQAVAALSDNDNLEVVGRARGDNCAARASEGSGEYSLDDIEIARTCSSLRVIGDTLPSALNTEATLSSFNQLLLWSNNGAGVSIEGLSEETTITSTTVSLTEDGASEESSADGTSATTSTIHGVGVAISLDDSATRVRSALDTIESSVRNYDIKTASLVWSGDDNQNIELSATFSAYYADSVAVKKKKLKVCADYKNKKCVSTTADKSAEPKATTTITTSSTENSTDGSAN